MAAIEILRTGRVTDRAGNLILSVTEQLLKDVLNFFTQDPTGVPIILGHPDRYGSAEPPAFAWVKSLAIEGGKRLMATLERIDPTIQTMVNEGKFPNCSVEMEQGEGDRWQLTAIGLLGKSRPAVKGMERVKLSLLEKSKKRILLMETDGMGMDDLTAETSGFIFEHQIVDSLEALSNAHAALSPGLQVIKPETLLAMRQHIANCLLKAAQDVAADSGIMPADPMPADPMPPVEMMANPDDAMSMQLSQAMAELAKGRAELAQQRESLAFQNRVLQLSERLTKSSLKDLLPDQKEKFMAILKALPANQKLQFSQNGVKVQANLEEALFSLIEDVRDRRVEFGEIAPNTLGSGQGKSALAVAIDSKRLGYESKWRTTAHGN